MFTDSLSCLELSVGCVLKQKESLRCTEMSNVAVKTQGESCVLSNNFNI